MKTKTIPHQYFSMIFILWLAACATPPTPITPTSQPTVTNVPTLFPTPTPTLPPTMTSIPSVVVNGLRVAYIVDGDLFVQDSGGQPIQRTHSDLEDSFPIFSDDGEKIIFGRGKPITYITKGDGTSYAVPQQIDQYLINTDGSKEEILFPSGSFVKLNLGYGEATRGCNFAFIPNTHNLLFTTCDLQQPSSDSSQPVDLLASKRNKDLFLLNTDTMEIKQMLAPNQGGVFHLLSPDKKFDIDYKENYIDLLSTSGQTARRHMITYLHDWDNEWTEAIWSQDSRTFTFIAPINGNSDGTDGISPDTIWQYLMDKNSAVEIRLNPPPIGDNYTFSPDGNWVVYSCCLEEADLSFPTGLYLGNLRDGSSRLISSEQLYGLPELNQWSPNSKYFFFYNGNKMYLGNIDGEINPLADTGHWFGWLDNQRYLYKKDNLIMMGQIGQKESTSVLSLPIELKPSNHFTYILIESK